MIFKLAWESFVMRVTDTFSVSDTAPKSTRQTSTGLPSVTVSFPRLTTTTAKRVCESTDRVWQRLSEYGGHVQQDIIQSVREKKSLAA